jgi:hypothetical protein
MRGILTVLPETDIQKLAVESRQRLIQEFADTYANLRERELACPFEVASVAYLINMDGILGIRQAVDLFTSELVRRANAGEDVPNLPGNLMEFVLVEGRWVSHLYGRFSRQLELQGRSLANLEEVIEFKSIEVEKALSIIAERTKIAEAFIAPILEEWTKDHPKSISLDAVTTFGQAITRWNRNTLNGKLKQILRRTQAHFRILREALLKASDSFTIDASISRLDRLISELEADLEKLTFRAVSHLLVHLIPRPTSGRGDRSPFVDVGVRSTRGNKAEPDLTSPFDFLERDVKLARRRRGEERAEYLLERIGRVIRVLKYQGNDIVDCIGKCFTELAERFGLDHIELESEIESARAQIIEALVSERDSLAIRIVHSFVDTHIYLEEAIH